MTISEVKAICEELEKQGKGDYIAGMWGEVTGRFNTIGDFIGNMEGHKEWNGKVFVMDNSKDVSFGDCGE